MVIYETRQFRPEFAWPMTAVLGGLCAVLAITSSWQIAVLLAVLLFLPMLIAAIVISRDRRNGEAWLTLDDLPQAGKPIHGRVDTQLSEPRPLEARLDLIDVEGDSIWSKKWTIAYPYDVVIEIPSLRDRYGKWFLTVRAPFYKRRFELPV